MQDFNSQADILLPYLLTGRSWVVVERDEGDEGGRKQKTPGIVRIISEGTRGGQHMA